MNEESTRKEVSEHSREQHTNDQQYPSHTQPRPPKRGYLCDDIHYIRGAVRHVGQNCEDKEQQQSVGVQYRP